MTSALWRSRQEFASSVRPGQSRRSAGGEGRAPAGDASIGDATDTVPIDISSFAKATPSRRIFVRARRRCPGTTMVWCVARETVRHHLGEKVSRAVCEQDFPDARRVQRQPAAPPGDHPRGTSAGDLLDVQRLCSVEDGEVDVLTCERRGGQRTDFPQPQPDLITATFDSLETTPSHQFGRKEVCGGLRKRGALSQLLQ